MVGAGSERTTPNRLVTLARSLVPNIETRQSSVPVRARHTLALQLRAFSTTQAAILFGRTEARREA